MTSEVTPTCWAVTPPGEAHCAADNSKPCAHHIGCNLHSEPSRESYTSKAHRIVRRGMSWGRDGLDPSQGLALPVFEEQDLAPTSTKASVRSLARSITGKWRPATIFTFSFPGIVSASASPWAPAETNKRVCAERQGGRGRSGSPRGAARTSGSARVTDSGGRARVRRAAGRHALSEEEGCRPVPEPRPHSGEAARLPLVDSSAPVLQCWQETQKRVNIALSFCRRY